MKVIIAEKPSLARNIADSIGDMKKSNGYYYNNEYYVTWAFGHLFSLYDIEDYTKTEDKRWKMDNLPFFPETFKFKLKENNNQIDQGVLKQFNIIKELINKDEVDTIINAGDADREGEIIVRLCIENSLNTKKNLVRLWLPDQTKETILSSLKEMKDEKEYDNLANEGFARTYIDWLYGVNLTRYATLKTGTLERVGRVIVPIVKAIYDRDKSIENFVQDIYYGIESKAITNGEEVVLTSKLKFDKKDLEKAKQKCLEYNKQQAIVISKSKKKDIMNPSKLFSLSKLQNLLGKKYKMSMDKSLSIIQKLYESGYLTYPRTNSEYLAEAEKDKIKKIIDNFKKLNYPVTFKDKKTIFNDSKIESHSALTPTYKIPDIKELTEDEKIVYKTVVKRFVAVFCDTDCVIEKTEIKIKINDEEFNLKGNVIIDPGWTKYDEYNTKDKILPNLEEKDIVNILFEPVEKKTTAPKHYTIETLNNYLKNPFKEDKNKDEYDDEEDYKAIFEGLELGTEATRTGIIDNAIKSEYISLKKDVYTILPKGEYLIESLINMNISMDKYKTSEMGKALKKVFHNEITINDSVSLARKEIEDVFNKKEIPIEKSTDMGFFKEIIGKCPKCGKDVIRNRYGYGCSNYNECDFKISGTICKRAISIENAKLLLENGKSSKIEGFISKKGTTFNSYLVLKDNKVEFDFSL